MNVFLAGYNVDADVLEELKGNSSRTDITPETLSASYARISRDPRPINELRVAARQEIEKSRKSNEAIIFGLGHSSVAEHAVFNFDIINVSRYAMEYIERARLCSFTEKSQRYITLNKDYLIPEEIGQSEFKNQFIDLIERQNNMYQALFEKLKGYVYESHPDLASDPKKQGLLEGWAKEDARYITSLATYSQVGMTLNARNLEKMLRTLSAADVAEVQQLSQQLYELVKDITPSIVKYPEPTDFERKTYPDLAAIAHDTLEPKKPSNKPCTLFDATKDGDEKIIAALLFSTTNQSYSAILRQVKKMTQKQKKDIFKTAVKHMKLYHQVIREFEMAELTFGVTVSAACFGQLKRHRMATILSQKYNPKLGIVIPPSITAIGMDKKFKSIVRETEDLYDKVMYRYPQAAEYCLTNAHQKQVVIKTNLRAMYHISRLREDKHAQWDIQRISALMAEKAKSVFPITTLAIGGKDSFSEIYSKLFTD
jgi:flavin-dependent thymidylate synthase